MMPGKQNMTQFDFKFSPWVNRFNLIFADLIAFSIAFIVSRNLIEILGEKNPGFLQWMNTTPGQARIWVFVACNIKYYLVLGSSPSLHLS